MSKREEHIPTQKVDHEQGKRRVFFREKVYEQNKDKIGEGKIFESEAEFNIWFNAHNLGRDAKGENCFGHYKVPDLIDKAHPLILPQGFTYEDVIIPCKVVAKDTPPTPSVLFQPPPPPPAPPAPESMTLNAAAIPLPQWVSGGGSGQQAITSNGGDRSFNAYDHLNYGLLHGRLPAQPHVAARGNNPNDPGFQTVGDALRGFVGVIDVPAQLAGTAALGGPVAGAFLKIGQGDRADRWMVAPEGSPRHNGDKLLDFSNQWPFNGQANPFSPSRDEQLRATHLPGFYPLDTQTGRMGQVDPKFAIVKGSNPLYTLADESPALTSNERGVRTNHREENERFGGTPSAPQVLRGGVDRAQSWDANNLNMLPLLQEGQQAYEAATGDAKKAAAQHMVDLINYQSTYKFIQAEPVLQAQTWAARDAFIAKAEQDGVTGLDRFHMAAESPDQTVTKAEMRANLTKYYTEMATNKKTDGKFNNFYDMMVDGKSIDPAQRVKDIHDPEQRKVAISQAVEALPLMLSYKDLPEDGRLPVASDNFVSTRDPAHPTDVRYNNLNPFEKGEFTPQKAPTDAKAAMDAGMQDIAGDKELTKLVLQGAGGDYHIAEAILQRDVQSKELPRYFGEKHGIRASRTPAIEKIAALNYSDKTLSEVFDIQREKDGSLNYKKEAAHGQIGNMSAPIDSDTVRRAQGEIAGRVESQEMVAATQQAFKTLGADGSKNPIFSQGVLRDRLLYALATERGSKTLLAMQAKIRETDPEHADARIEQLKEAMHAAANVGSKQRSGVDWDTQQEIANAQRVDIAEKALGTQASVDANGNITFTTAPGAQIPDNVKALLAGGGVAATAANAPYFDTARAVALAQTPEATGSAYLINPETRQRALLAIAKSEPEVMQAAIINTVVANPQMAREAADALKSAGTVHRNDLINHIFHTDRHSKLGGILKDLAEAQESGNQNDLAKASERLRAFGKVDLSTKEGQQNQQALADLNAFVLTGNAAGKQLGNAAQYQANLGNTLVYAMQNGTLASKAPGTDTQIAAAGSDKTAPGTEQTAPGSDKTDHAPEGNGNHTPGKGRGKHVLLAGQPGYTNDLANFGISNDQLTNAAKAMPEAVRNMHVVDAEGLANTGHEVADHAYTVTGKYQGLPLIVVPVPHGKKNPDLNHGNPGDCEGPCQVPGNPGTPLPPTPPVTPPGNCTIVNSDGVTVPCIG